MKTLDYQTLKSKNALKLATKTQLYPWLVIFLSALFLFYKYVLQVSPSVMTNELMRHFHVDGAGLGNLAATFFYSYLVMQLFVGPLLDRYSPRLLTALAILASAIGALFFSRSQTLISAELARSLVGIGAAFATVSYMKMASLWFKPQRFAFVAGFLATAAMIGSMAGQVPMAYMVSHFGWQSSLFYVGLAGLALTVIFYAFVKNKKENTTNQPVTSKSLKWRDCAQLLKHKHNWYLMLYSGLAFSPCAVFGGLWGNPFLQEAFHISKPQAASLTSLMFLGLAVGGPILGVISDKLRKRFEIMLLGILLSLVTLTLTLYVPNLPSWLAAIFLFSFGFGTGAFMLGFAMGKELNCISLAATVIALINTGDALFGAFSEPFVGKVLDVFWDGKIAHGVHYFSIYDFHLAFLVMPAYLLFALFFLFMLRKTANNKVSTKSINQTS